MAAETPKSGRGPAKQRLRNLSHLRFADLLQPEEFLQTLAATPADRPSKPSPSRRLRGYDLTDERFMMENNVSFSKGVLRFAIRRKFRLV